MGVEGIEFMPLSTSELLSSSAKNLDRTVVDAHEGGKIRSQV